MLTKANANWEEYLTPAPISIAFLGELVFISSKQDFSIKEGEPTGGFKFIKYPDSFRACLMQVCNSGWRAFNEAHKNMDKICLYTKNVPAYMKSAVEILLQEDDFLIKNLLPDALANISKISKDCVTLAKSTEERFTDVTELISELLETCTSAKQHYGVHLVDVRRILEQEKQKKKMFQEQEEQAKKESERLSKELKNANQHFEKAMNSFPSGWEIIGMNFVEALTSGVTQIIGSAGDLIFNKSCLLLPIAQTLSGFVQGDQIQWKNIIDPPTGKSVCNWMNTEVEDMISALQNMDNSSAKTKAENISQQALSIFSELKKMSPEGKHDDESANKELIQQIKKLMKSTQEFDSLGKKQSNTSAFSVKPPGVAKAQSSSLSSAGQTATENARFRTEQMRIQLDQARQLYDKSLEKMELKKKELTDTLIKMRSCKVHEIDFETTIKLLAEGLQAMGSLQEKWRKMVQFFQMISNLIDTSLETSLKDFVKTCEGPYPKNMAYSSKMFVKDMLYQQAFKASDIANLVNMISGTYTEISSKYLMDRVGSLSRLMALDPKDSKFKEERLALGTSCDDAGKSIRDLVLKNKELYQSKTKQRLQNIENELNAVLPQLSEEKLKEIQDAVEIGFKEDPDTEQYV